ARCGIPLHGAFLQGRYEILGLISKDRETATLEATDHHGGQAVTVRALIPKGSNVQAREEFLQDAELAQSLSARVSDPGSIRVTDYGQDGPVAFLVKTELLLTTQEPRPLQPHIVAR